MATSQPCHHILPSGTRCGSPALRHEQFCFYHHPTRRPPRRIPSPRIRFDLPAITDAEAVQMILAEVIRRVADGTLDTKRAGLILQTVQIARANLAALPAFNPFAASAVFHPDDETTPESAAPGVRAAEAGSPDSSDLSDLLAILGPT